MVLAEGLGMHVTGRLQALSLEQIVGRLPSAVVVFDADGDVRYRNARARDLGERHIGVPVAAHLGGAYDLHHLDGRRYDPEEWPVVRSMATGEEVVDEEFFRLLPDGNRLDFRCCSAPVYDEEAAIVGAVLVVDEISEERETARQLADHRRLQESMQDGVIAVDAGMRITTWNAAAERLYGWSAAEAMGRKAPDLAGPLIGYGPAATFTDELTQQQRTRMQVTARRRDGTTVDVEIIGTAMTDAGGEPVGYLAIHRDVTERRRAHEALQASQRRVEEILESITDAFCALDRAGHITYINDRALRWACESGGVPLDREEVLGHSLWERLPAVAGTALEASLRRALREQHAAVFEYRSPDEGPWLEVHAYPSAHGLSIYFRDISDRKQAEAEQARRRHRQALIADLGLRAAASGNVQDVADAAVALVARTLEVEQVAVMEVLPDSPNLVLRAGVGWADGAVGRATADGGHASLCGYAIRVGVPVVSEDADVDERFLLPLRSWGAEIASAATVVVAGRERPFGVLCAFARERHRFSHDDVHVLQSVANLVASAAEREAIARGLQEVRDAERSRIARDLHDDALSELSVAMARIRSEQRSGAVGDALLRVGRQLRGAIYDLTLTDDEDRPFAARLDELIEVQRDLASPTSVGFTARALPAESLGPLGTQVLRILREAITNARRHAEARHIEVNVTVAAGMLHATVCDDGRGFDELAALPPSCAEQQGLRGMRERAAAANGRLDVEPRRGPGTRVRLRLPLPTVLPDATPPTRVLLVEDHRTVREAIAAALEREPDFQVVAQAGSVAEGRAVLADVDVAVIDLMLPDGYGSDLIPELRAINRKAQAIVLTATLDRAEIARAVESGASAALHKSAALDEIADSLRRLQGGEALLPLDDVVELIALARRHRREEHADRAAIASVTPREREVLQALADGRDTQQIAQDLHITVRTQRNHVANILRKLGVHSQLQAIVLALRYGLVEVQRARTDSPAGGRGLLGADPGGEPGLGGAGGA
jgi:PAS domain S-box-containing protein